MKKAFGRLEKVLDEIEYLFYYILENIRINKFNNKMQILRTKFKNEIISEFLVPLKPSKKVIILCGGMPSYPGKKDDLMKFLSKKGYWVFLPRYRGSWESSGSFLKISPYQDVVDIINELPRGFSDLWSGKKYKIKNPQIYLIGSSFGGPAVILASKDKRVKKAVAFSPVIDWRKESKIESVNSLGKFTKIAFGNGYRFTIKNWNKLKSGRFYNPINEIEDVDAKKLFIIHAKDDKVVYSKPSENFAKLTKCKFLLLKTGGHLSYSNLMLSKFWRKIKRFF